MFPLRKKLVLLICFVANALCMTETQTETSTAATSTTSSATSTYTVTGGPPKRPSDFIVTVEAEEALYSTLNIRWTSYDEDATDRYLIEIAFLDNPTNWIRLLSVGRGDCCDVVYDHLGQSRMARLRISAMNAYGTSDYAETGEIFLPNHRKSTYTLSLRDGGKNKLQVEWSLQCGFQVETFALSYRLLESAEWQIGESLLGDTFHTTLDILYSREYLIQLSAYDSENNIVGHSEAVYYKTWPEARDYLVLTPDGSNATVVEATFASELPPAPKYVLYVYANSVESEPNKTSLDKFPVTITHSIKALKYIFKLDVLSQDDEKAIHSLGLFVFYGEEGLPDPVNSATTKRLPTKRTDDHVSVRVTWSPPLNVNGFVRGYKIRWKLLKSPFNIFEVEQCDNSYDLKAYSQEETYEVFISARTSKGYGPEKQLMFAIGSPPDWHFSIPSGRTTKPPRVVSYPEVDQREFEQRLRKKVGHEYRVHPARVILSVATFVISMIFSWFLKLIFIPSPPPRVSRRRVRLRSSSSVADKRRKTSSER